MRGIYFIEKYYKNLYNSKEVKHAIRFHKNRKGKTSICCSGWKRN